jgi:hypothetical protein
MALVVDRHRERPLLLAGAPGTVTATRDREAWKIWRVYISLRASVVRMRVWRRWKRMYSVAVSAS